MFKTNFKRAAAILLSVSMLFTSVNVPSFAEEATEESTEWQAEETEFAELESNTAAEVEEENIEELKPAYVEPETEAVTEISDIQEIVESEIPSEEIIDVPVEEPAEIVIPETEAPVEEEVPVEEYQDLVESIETEGFVTEMEGMSEAEKETPADDSIDDGADAAESNISSLENNIAPTQEAWSWSEAGWQADVPFETYAVEQLSESIEDPANHSTSVQLATENETETVEEETWEKPYAVLAIGDYVNHVLKCLACFK